MPVIVERNGGAGYQCSSTSQLRLFSIQVEEHSTVYKIQRYDQLPLAVATKDSSLKARKWAGPDPNSFARDEERKRLCFPFLDAGLNPFHFGVWDSRYFSIQCKKANYSGK
jgi:hypothetical protein